MEESQASEQHFPVSVMQVREFFSSYCSMTIRGEKTKKHIQHGTETTTPPLSGKVLQKYRRGGKAPTTSKH
jgi:hypothetical protein